VKNCKLKLSKPAILTTPLRFACSPSLAHIERNIFELRSPKISAPDSVKIVSAPNARAEIRFVARRILQLVKQRDYRYREIAVIASDIERYQHYIRGYFGDYNIPFFVDRRKPLNQHPVVELVCSALQVVISGFSHDDLFSYLKTDLLPVPRCDIDTLENYCLEFGISAADWQSEQDWRFARQEDSHFEEERINQIRRSVSEPLLKMRGRLCVRDVAQEAVAADEFAQVVFDFLDSLCVTRKLGDWLKQATEVGDYTVADEHRQFYDKLISVFDELTEIFAGQKMTAADYLAILSSAFSQLTLAFIPPTLDQVLVGSIDRSRHPDLKAVFLIGATQRQFPAPVSLAGILTDEDRQAAGSAGFPLAPTARQKLVERQYLAYIAFTRPSEFLYVTYPLIDDRGSPECRSQFIANLESLFEDLREESITAEQISVENIHNKGELTDVLCTRLGRDASADSAPSSRDFLRELLEDIARDEQLAEVGSHVVSAVDYDNLARLDKSTIEKLFDRHLDSSATRLSTFAACPYQYFARYILALEERREFKFEPLDVGIFYHRVLDRLLKRLSAEATDFASIDDAQLLKFLREQIAELVQTDSFISKFARHSAHNAFIIHSAGEVLEDCVRAIAQMVRAGSFRPSRSEVAFGDVKGTVDTLGEYSIGLLHGRVLSLYGKIDRLDTADINGRSVTVIFDYKRRDKSFNWSQFYHGLDMQLPIYMLAVRNAADTQADVVGAFYMPVEVAPKQTTLDELSSTAESFGYKAKGLFNGEFAPQLDGNASRNSSFYNFYVTRDGEPYGSYDNRGALKPLDFEKILKFTEKKTVQLAEEIISGKIDVNPYRLGTQSPCSYCRYKPVCRFDWQINDYNFLQSVRKPAVLDEIGNS
jgi:ATP-dependent helicase/nuclease subunit B